ncbi:MAG: glycosyltransferase family 4 protein [Hydrogenophaga sp.]|uniref:exopolysaccharide biosynthesis GT4 family glycosyltransferase EpsE n=1 Tax=Hydrogenophaga sp. TaxID=1904254 RepID=UPI0025C388D9|nr:exopolysaccharide biosynthesis GT4 family glycosyltransferase EpsE [Hydrogenophaga sp.]MBT9551245.1 glycosyltransferase family 4 protein [Hydrogenophaga sp.]
MEKSANATRPTRIGYLVSEFPAQTHIFFWREISALRDLGVDTVLISTRQPAQGTISHRWAESAIRDTHYLLSKNWFDWIAALFFLLRRSAGRMGSLVAALGDDEYAGARSRFNLMVCLLVASRLARFVHAHRLDHVHVGSCGRSAEIAALGSILGDFTYSLSMLGPTFSTYGRQHRLKWRHAAFGLFQSQMLVQEGRQRLGPDFPKRYAQAPVGVDTDRMDRTQPYQAWRPGDPCRLYSCGRLNPVKGHEDVIDAVCLLRARGIDARLIIGGEDERGGTGYRLDVQKHIAKCEASSFVQLLGAVSEETNRSQYEAAHVYVMGSHDEAAGAVAAMEAMAMATPVVMCRAGATAELITDGEDGLLTEPRSPAQMADAVERVLRDPALADHLRLNGRKKIQSRYSHRVSAEALHRLLDA